MISHKRRNNQTIRKKVFKRDNFTCQKCKFEDKTARKLELHHIKPVYMKGTDDLNNLITLCFDCHKYAPNNMKEFKEYMKEETEGTLTTLVNVWKKFQKQHPELTKELMKKNM